MKLYVKYLSLGLITILRGRFFSFLPTRKSSEKTAKMTSTGNRMYIVTSYSVGLGKGEVSSSYTRA